MTSPLGQAWRSFWHTMTSNDRHASHDSPYRTGRHVPLNQNRSAPLTSVATSAIESRPDLPSSIDEDSSRRSGNAGSQTWSAPPGPITSPNRPYSPGMRSISSQQRRSQENNGVDGGEIQMQSFHDGAPPPPPVSHSWKKIDRWTEKNYEELFDQLCEGCTMNDVNELEHDLDCSLPLDIRESLQVHDGQERGGLPTGVIFGCMLLDCEEIVQEWKNWKTVNDEFLSAAPVTSEPQPPLKAYAGPSSASSSSAPPPPPQQASNPLWRQELLDRQDSQPPRSIQKAYAHPSWIPVARDWGGNNIAIDLAPGPAGKWGQVIVFGRDFDCKYVIARSWSAFLATFADDIHSDKVIVDEDSGEMRLKQFKDPNVNPPYIQILRWRADQKHGRKPMKRRSANGLGLNTNVNGKTGRDSPYSSTSPIVEERGRSPHRFPPRGTNASPMTAGASSRLAMVTEETPANAGKQGEPSSLAATTGPPKSEKLVDIISPVNTTKSESSSANGTESNPVPEEASTHDNKPEKGKQDSSNATPRSSTGLDAKAIDGMKNIEI